MSGTFERCWSDCWPRRRLPGRVLQVPAIGEWTHRQRSVVAVVAGWDELDEFTHGYFTQSVYERVRAQTEFEVLRHSVLERWAD